MNSLFFQSYQYILFVGMHRYPFKGKLTTTPMFLEAVFGPPLGAARLASKCWLPFSPLLSMLTFAS